MAGPGDRAIVKSSQHDIGALFGLISDETSGD